MSQIVVVTPERLIGIYEQYKRLCARLISEIVLVHPDQHKDAFRLHSALIKACDGFDFRDLTLEQATRLDMRVFDDYHNYNDEENANPSESLILFPLWMLPIIPTYIELRTIGGRRILPFDSGPKRDATWDSDARGGLLAYGMMNYQFRYRKVLIEKHKAVMEASFAVMGS